MTAIQLQLLQVRAARPLISGDPDLRALMAEVLEVGFPHVSEDQLREVEVRWNPRLRSTVGRALSPGAPGVPSVELSPQYHEAYPDEVRETLAHELAHVLNWGAGHGPVWRVELAAAIDRLGVEVRGSMRLARRLAPAPGSRYTWVCGGCGETIAHRDRRRADEVAMATRCCGAPVVVLDARLDGLTAAPRPYLVRCRSCGTSFRAYDDLPKARHFARRHRCPCDGGLQVLPVVP